MLGLYAVTAYSVIERHREFALRLALGSTRTDRLPVGTEWEHVDGNRGSRDWCPRLHCSGAFAAAACSFWGCAFRPDELLTRRVLLLITVFLSGMVAARRAGIGRA